MDRLSSVCMLFVCIVLLAWRSSAKDYTSSLSSSGEDGEFSTICMVGLLIPSTNLVPLDGMGV